MFKYPVIKQPHIAASYTNNDRLYIQKQGNK